MGKCLNCGIEFESERVTAKFCSGKCRAIASRVSAQVPFKPCAKPCAKDIAQGVIKGIDRINMGGLHDLPDKIATDFPNLDAFQDYVTNRNKAMRDKLAATPLSHLKAVGAWIPVWRYAQG